MSNSQINSISDFSDKYWFYSQIFLLTAGLISNTALILIFVTLRVFRGNRCTFYLTAESVANIGFILLNSPAYIYRYVADQDPVLISTVWCKIHNSISHTLGLCSLFTVCFLTFDQYMSTNPRPNFRQISSLKLAHRLTLGNACFVLLHTIPFLILTENHQGNLCTIDNIVLSVYFKYFYYPILSAAIPLLITLTFSLLAYRNVRRLIRQRITIFRRRLDRQLTAMVLARVFCLILFGSPYIIYSVYYINVSVTNGNQLQMTIFRLITRIVYSILFLNYTVKSKAIFNRLDFDMECVSLLDELLCVSHHIIKISSASEIFPDEKMLESL